ncbi:putative NADH dehydrogenase/NAD(P)H nitroreductase [Tersicoccus solisilvae]|uniref:NADH dehydrogenase/NAD(P)H nitroreductase n=1 Tax=Tersicoccus solisilvae TaxID=1882339 RepID=A0ABQ1NHY5_9MICC|nr:malonic semialdehyde reductase [Tersicoccus solisilvae]GGC77700.1 putative NADH dehydrogenase/NAD(P)H nitroreductase [Tersicoccus solisilvae]
MTTQIAETVLDEHAADLLFREGRTANTFTDDIVTDEQLRAIWDLAKMGPTAFNSQPLRVTWVRDGEPRERLVRHMARGNQAKTVAAPVVAVLSYDTRWHRRFDDFMPGMPERTAPMAENFAANEALSHQIANNNANMQAGYFVLAVRALGLDAGPMSGFDAAGLDADFFPDGSQKSFAVINIGHAAEDAWGPAKPRFSFEDATTTL